MKRLFHYTTASRLKKILAAKAISLATANVPKNEKPAAWFSYRQDWEPTATPGFRENGTIRDVTFDELPKLDTPARIEIDPLAAPCNWRQWRKLSGATSKHYKALEEVALRQNASVSDWQVSFDAVGIERWYAVELFVDGEWQDFKKIFSLQPAAGSEQSPLSANAKCQDVQTGRGIK